MNRLKKFTSVKVLNSGENKSDLQKPFLIAEWRKLAIANYKIDPSVLTPFIPSKTEIDLWKGDCYLSLVGFMFLNTKVKGVKIPFHVNFEEVNLRFYVKHFDGKEWKRGVTFIKEIVPKTMITLVANSLYKEKYETMRMDHHWKAENENLFVEYLWKKGEWNSFKILAENDLIGIAKDSEEEFITEHYWGYTRINENKTAEYEVEHPRWNTYSVKEFEIKVNFEKIYGKKFSFLTGTCPHSVMLAEGSEIKVNKGMMISS